MITNLLGGAAEAAVPSQALRSAQPIISAAGVNDLGALARQQLTIATPAPSFIAAYTPGIVPQKPAPRPAINIAASPLAAQFIAQDANLTSDDLAIFSLQGWDLTFGI